MINPGFILVPLYLYPSSGAWDPLFNAAKVNPNVNFAVVVNPYDGPGGGSCPDANFIDVLTTLNGIPNIQSLAYVHTADRYDCGESGTDICTCSQPLSAVEANITTYLQWPTADCSANNAKDIHIDGFFMDEAPSNATCLDYMSQLTSFAKGNDTNGKTVLFNSGSSVDASYWGVADYINVFENNEAAYDTADIAALDDNGKYHSQSTMIIYGYTDGAAIEQRDVNTILSPQHDAFAALYITDLNTYSGFPTNFTGFVSDVGNTLS